MWSKIVKYTQIICEILELIVGFIVMVSIVIGIAALIPKLFAYCNTMTESTSLMIFLEHVFNVVIGIEFLKMLLKPNSDNIMETLIFLVARHMTIGNTTPMEDFVSVISVAILCILRRYLHITKDDQDNLIISKIFSKKEH